MLKKIVKTTFQPIQVAFDWIEKNAESFKTLESTSLMIAQSLFTLEDGDGDTFKNFLKSYHHLKNVKESNLHNEFDEHDYVPIGNFIYLSKSDGARKADLLPSNGKIIESILQ